jgi:hypothetical protein
MASIGGIKGRGTAVESTGPNGHTVLNGRIRVRSEDYSRVGDLFANIEPVEYCGPIVRNGKRSTERRAVFLLRVDVPTAAAVSVYFEHVLPWPPSSRSDEPNATRQSS